MRMFAVALVLALSGSTSATSLASTSLAPAASATSSAVASKPDHRARVVPPLRARRVVTGLELPWDVKVLAPGRWLITERETRRLLLRTPEGLGAVAFPRGSVWVSGETGLMSLAVDPGFAANRRFYTCQGGFRAGGGHDVRVLAWRLSADGGRATRSRLLLAGLPATSGRHGGCRLLVQDTGALLVGTGDAATGRNPQNLRSLGGKVLRLNRWTGRPWRHNPWPHAASVKRRYILTYGHRNVQGLAQRRDGTLWSVEHGTYRDDEVNRLVNGGNYGWNPVPGYNETVPMTDFSLPGRQIGARWRSGNPTLATSGAAWVYGEQWGRLNGTLAVAALKASRLVFMKFDRRGRLRWTVTPQATRRFGRLRSVTRTPVGDLLVTTSNGDGDAVVRVTPR